jgi:hypothetical protein
MADGLDPVRVLRVMARPVVGGELHALGVRDLSSFGGPDVYVPPEYLSFVRELVDEALGHETPTKRRKRRAGPGRSKREVLVAEATDTATFPLFAARRCRNCPSSLPSSSHSTSPRRTRSRR